MALEFKDATFENEVLSSDKVAIIDFWAEWCGPCKAIAPIIDELAEDYKDQALIGKVDVDSNPEISMRYGIRNIPTILFIKGGEVVDKQVGAVPKSMLEDTLKKHL
jgi:thioredoxin 1